VRQCPAMTDPGVQRGLQFEIVGDKSRRTKKYDGSYSGAIRINTVLRIHLWWGLMAKEKLLADLFCSGKNGKDGAVAAELKAAIRKAARRPRAR
jgi:hypothetical protein